MRTAQPATVFQSGEPVDVVLGVQAARELHRFRLRRRRSTAPTACAATARTPTSKARRPQRLAGNGEVVFRIDALDLTAGTYRLDVAVHRADGVPYDYHRLLYSFRVTSPVKDIGFFRPKHGWSFSGGVRDRRPAARRAGPHEGPGPGAGAGSPSASTPPWRSSRACATAAEPSSSPTASSTWCTPATSATSRPRARLATR